MPRESFCLKCQKKLQKSRTEAGRTAGGHRKTQARENDEGESDESDESKPARRTVSTGESEQPTRFGNGLDTVGKGMQAPNEHQPLSAFSRVWDPFV